MQVSHERPGCQAKAVSIDIAGLGWRRFAVCGDKRLFARVCRAEPFAKSILVSAFTGIVAVGQTLVIISGGIDLSIPWVLNSAAVLVTLASNGLDAPLIWAAAGAIVGALNGTGIAWFRIPPIIMTLSVNTILQDPW